MLRRCWSAVRPLPQGGICGHSRCASSTTTVTLRSYQKDCVEASLQAMAAGQRRIAVSLPVGSGKTTVFSSLIPKIPDPVPGARRTLVLAHRTELLEQACARISEQNPSLSVEIEQGKRVASAAADVVVASVPTLGRSGSPRLSKFSPTHFKAIIIDEAHHSTSSTYLRILDHFGARDSDTRIVTWGCSATLRRHDGVSLGSVFESIAYSRSIIQMWEEGWLCRASALQMSTGVSLSGVPTSSTTGDFVTAKLSAAVNTAARNQLVVDAWKAIDADKRKSTLVFAADVEHILSLQAAFHESGVRACAVHGKTTADDRAAVLRGFRAGQIEVVVNCGIFTEGTDIPNIDTIVMARPTRSSVLYQQMLGRGLRTSPGKQRCVILDITDNMKRNTAMTAPSLMGLVPNFDAQGGDILDVYRDMIKITARCPGAGAANSLAAAKAEHAKLMELSGPRLKADIKEGPLRLASAGDTDGSAGALNFVPLTDGDFVLALTPTRVIRLSENFLGVWRGVIEDIPDHHAPWSNALGNAESRHRNELPLDADSAEQAFAAVKTYLQREQPEVYRQLVSKPRQYSTEPPTKRQLELIKRLTRGRVTSVRNKGNASILIERLLGARKDRVLQRKLTPNKPRPIIPQFDLSAIN